MFGLKFQNFVMLQEISIEGYLQLDWEDKRVKRISNLKDDWTLLNVEDALKTFWLPDIWVESLRDFEIHRSLKNQATFNINNQSHFCYWQSVTLKASCDMNFELYPFDCQRCDLRFSSSKFYGQ